MKNFHDGGVCIRFFPGSGKKKFMGPDPVCADRLDPDPVNIRPDPNLLHTFNFKTLL